MKIFFWENMGSQYRTALRCENPVSYTFHVLAMKRCPREHADNLFCVPLRADIGPSGGRYGPETTDQGKFF